MHWSRGAPRFFAPLGALIAAGCEAALGSPADASSPDASADAGIDAGPTPADAGASGRVIYPIDRTQSPLTEDLALGLRAVLPRATDLSDDVLAKVGASATASPSFLRCFAGTSVDLDGRDALQETVAHFAAGDAAGSDPFTRESLCAVPGWHAGRALSGDPAPIDQEVEGILPRFAVVMYGTNDLGIVTPETYARNMLALTDRLLDRGVIPLLTTIMPRDDSASAGAQVPLFNLVVRAVAQGRGVPLIDFHRELAALPDHGLGPDGVHPSTYYASGAYRACVFTQEGLRFGYNIRNSITLEALDRVRRTVLEGVGAPDADAPRQAGAGTHASPYAIGALPYTDVRSTLFSSERALARYDGCGASQDESGPEIVYRLELGAPATLVARVFSREGVDVDLHLVDDTSSEQGCLLRDDREITASLDAGTYYFVLDTYVSAAGERAGEYVFVLMPG